MSLRVTRAKGTTIQIAGGAGRQGCAVGHGLARIYRRTQNPGKIILTDIDAKALDKAQGRLRELVSGVDIETQTISGASVPTFERAFRGSDMVFSALPHRFNRRATEAALRVSASYSDLGMDPEITDYQHVMALTAQSRGSTVIPDNGLAPGLVILLASIAATRLEDTQKLRIFCGGLPSQPRDLPLHYACTWEWAGLLKEYRDNSLILRDGQLAYVPALSEPLEIETPDLPFDRCETDHTAGGSSTAPKYFLNRGLDFFEYRTVRYPGHFGFFRQNLDAIVGNTAELLTLPSGASIRANALEKLLRPKKRIQDLVFVRVEATDRDFQSGKRLEMLARASTATGFTAMERSTGYTAAIISNLVAQGKFPPGTIELESLPFDYSDFAEVFLAELKAQGLVVSGRDI